MQNADWALVISIIALLLAVASFVWSVWSMFIYPKPKISVSASIMKTFGTNIEQDFFVIHATNHGPNELTIRHAVQAEYKNCFSKKLKSLFILQPLNNPQEYPFDKSASLFGGELPKKLSVGDEFQVFFPVADEWFDLKRGRFGLYDTFGRYHLCSSKIVSELAEQSSQTDGS